MTFVALGAAVVAVTAAAVAAEAAWPAHLGAHLALLVGAGILWAAAVAALPRIARGRRDALVIAAVAVALRVPAWLAPPRHSDDVYRYAWDGRVTVAGVNPYRFAPAAPELAALRDGARPPLPAWERGPARPTDGSGPLWRRVNNADLPTIYPPGAQLLFAAAALLPLPPVAALKLLLGACDLALVAVLLFFLRRRGGDERAAIAWAWSPLVAVEVGQNAHLDALPILAVVGALAAWEAGRRGRAGALLGVAAAVKLLGLPLAAALRGWRAWLAALAACALLAAPFAAAGPALAGSTGEFARRWRANDGAYALLQAAADHAVCRALGDGPPPCRKPLDLWPRERLARLISGRDYRAAVYPDELGAFAARAAVALLLALVVGAVLVRRPPAVDGAEWILGALVLLTPALHPWYAAWLLPFAALQQRRAWLALAALAPLGYVPLAAWLAGGPWRDPVWTRALEHGACWALLAADVLRRRRA